MLSNQIVAKTSEVNRQITSANNVISAAKSDAEYLKGVADEYVEVTNKLSAILVKINQTAQEKANDCALA